MARYTLILLSDLHIGNSEKELNNTNQIVKSIGKSYKGIPVIVTGDLTNSATKGQFKTMREILHELSKTNPILTAPGNHDYAWYGIIFRHNGWENWVKYLSSPLGWGTDEYYWMGEDYEPVGIDGLGVFKHESCVYFGIDSGDPDDKENTARGYISTKLANALEQSLKKYEGKTRIAFLHHHPFDDRYFTALDGHEKLLKAVKNNCELLLFGHEHKYGIWWNHKGVPLIVSSHKSSLPMSGSCLMGTIIEMDRVGTPEVSFGHKLVAF
jgi:3',5'-cyclic AMP phosphodiesterase CpdA